MGWTNESQDLRSVFWTVSASNSYLTVETDSLPVRRKQLHITQPPFLPACFYPISVLGREARLRLQLRELHSTDSGSCWKCGLRKRRGKICSNSAHCDYPGPVSLLLSSLRHCILATKSPFQARISSLLFRVFTSCCIDVFGPFDRGQSSKTFLLNTLFQSYFMTPGGNNRRHSRIPSSRHVGFLCPIAPLFLGYGSCWPFPTSCAESECRNGWRPVHGFLSLYHFLFYGET